MNQFRCSIENTTWWTREDWRPRCALINEIHAGAQSKLNSFIKYLWHSPFQNERGGGGAKHSPPFRDHSSLAAGLLRGFLKAGDGIVTERRFYSDLQQFLSPLRPSVHAWLRGVKASTRWHKLFRVKQKSSRRSDVTSCVLMTSGP